MDAFTPKSIYCASTHIYYSIKVTDPIIDIIESEIIEFLKDNNKASPLSIIEDFLFDKGFSMEDIVMTYNILIFNDVISCDGTIVRLVEVK